MVSTTGIIKHCIKEIYETTLALHKVSSYDVGIADILAAHIWLQTELIRIMSSSLQHVTTQQQGFRQLDWLFLPLHFLLLGTYLTWFLQADSQGKVRK